MYAKFCPSCKTRMLYCPLDSGYVCPLCGTTINEWCVRRKVEKCPKCGKEAVIYDKIKKPVKRCLYCNWQKEVQSESADC
jgi:ribosomal protein S27E